MELVEGPTLADAIKAAPTGLPLDQVLSIARQIADALEAAHEQGIIHRDLKPDKSHHDPEAAFDVTRDGQHFLMVVASEEQAATQVNVVLNWFEGLKRRVTTLSSRRPT